MKVYVEKFVIGDNDDGKFINEQKSKIIEIPDEDLIGKQWYEPSEILFQRCKEAIDKELVTHIHYEIAEEGLAKDIPFLEKPFETVEEMREFLSRPEVIKEFELEG